MLVSFTVLLLCFDNYNYNTVVGYICGLESYMCRYIWTLHINSYTCILFKLVNTVYLDTALGLVNTVNTVCLLIVDF